MVREYICIYFAAAGTSDVESRFSHECSAEWGREEVWEGNSQAILLAVIEVEKKPHRGANCITGRWAIAPVAHWRLEDFSRLTTGVKRGKTAEKWGKKIRLLMRTSAAISRLITRVRVAVVRPHQHLFLHICRHISMRRFFFYALTNNYSDTYMHVFIKSILLLRSYQQSLWYI